MIERIQLYCTILLHVNLFMVRFRKIKFHCTSYESKTNVTNILHVLGKDTNFINLLSFYSMVENKCLLFSACVTCHSFYVVLQAAIQ